MTNNVVLSLVYASSVTFHITVFNDAAIMELKNPLSQLWDFFRHTTIHGAPYLTPDFRKEQDKISL